MAFPVPTLSFGTIRRLSLLNIFAYAKIDCRNSDFGASLTAIDRAIRIHVTVLVRTVILAVHEATRVDLAVEIGSTTAFVGRVPSAAPIAKYFSYMCFFCIPVISFN